MGNGINRASRRTMAGWGDCTARFSGSWQWIQQRIDARNKHGWITFGGNKAKNGRMKRWA